ncbi:zinc finger protein 878-like isoform X2 [Nilaparvata lugens]|nr:zinc finger protein 878-like isoform X2 [Nilaparvata lugens]
MKQEVVLVRNGDGPPVQKVVYVDFGDYWGMKREELASSHRQQVPYAFGEKKPQTIKDKLDGEPKRQRRKRCRDQQEAKKRVEGSETAVEEASASCVSVHGEEAEKPAEEEQEVEHRAVSNVEQEVDGASVKSKPDMWSSMCSISGPDATQVSRLDNKPKIYSCAHCSYETRWLYTLKIHVLNHTGEKPFRCEFCSYKCAQKAYLTKHIRVYHTGDKIPLTCKFCDFKCPNPRTLQSHILRTHKGEKSFSCKFCDFKCTTLNYLNLHNLRKHKRKTLYSCEYCDYECITLYFLKSHILRTHTEEKPLSCKFCDYKTARSTDLKRHTRTHTGEKPYSCKFCDYKCSDASYMKKHIRIHNEVENLS